MRIYPRRSRVETPTFYYRRVYTRRRVETPIFYYRHVYTRRRVETPIFYYRHVYTRRNSDRARVIAALKPVLEFMRAVRSAGKKPELGRLLMDFWRQECDEAHIPDLIHNVKELLKNQRGLLVIFNAVLPEHLKFRMLDEAGLESSEINQEND